MSGTEGSRFGKYRLLQKIATGGMGEVHLAKLKGPSGFEKLVVIKRLLDHRQKEQKYIDMFFAEARVAAQLNHNNIVQIYEVGNYDGVHYIAMEYLSGRSLRILLDASHDAGTPLHVAYTVHIIAEMCLGLAFAHDARHLSGAPMGLIHRDVNPHNVLVSYQGVVKVIDFGIAKSELNLDKTQAGTIKGTVVYMSPEQSSGFKLDKRSDLFAVGICLYEALTGLNPFYKDSLGASLEAIRHAVVPPIAQKSPELAVFAPILAKALARDPEARYPDCHALAADLQTLAHSGVLPKPPEPLRDYMRQLFADEIAAEERLLTQTELAEVPILGDTGTMVTFDGDLTQLDPSPLLAMTQDGLAESPPVPRESGDARQGVAKGWRLGASRPWEALRSRWRRAPRLAQYGALTLVVLLSGAALAGLLRPSAPAGHAGPTGLAAGAPGGVPTPDTQPSSAIGPAAAPPGPETLPTPAPRVGIAPLAAATPTPTPTPPPDPPERVMTLEEAPRDAGRHARRAVPHRRLKGHKGDSAGDSGVVGTLQMFMDPPVRVLLNGAAIAGTVKLKNNTGLLVFGTGQSAETDPFVIKLRYQVEQRAIHYSVESEPGAVVRGAGGIALGRTPLNDVAGEAATVFEFANPKQGLRQRITVRFVAF